MLFETKNQHIETNILRQAILEMLRMQRNSSFCPSKVVRWIYPQHWRHFMEDVQVEMMELYREGKIDVTQQGVAIDQDHLPLGPVRISKKK